ncbi:16S rRNA (guanine(527)-N(7))-methyltransferase RsmG [Acholeplasma hippikon]|uniref:Ribosomal RNA small subunit methyltransferase G n=1 Tax=Acholeplasma hippikon TaxID=264636 RepID=A0A449BKJ7_9MOLU|nr:16S rRNA (guanine(527)-N(7))-methyltransferase RsmG [Acholeplasma hippikon]VEU82986.1 methyltransferase GidB (glucose inhibiteddivision protein B) [Acholeplasma hippikon]
MNSHLIEKALKIKLNQDQIEKFQKYYKHLVDFNTHTNLTRITDEKEVYIKHFLDSVLISNLVDFNEINTICDMGAGAGFPSVPLLIVFPHLKVTIVESQIKRVKFLNELQEILGITFEVVHERAEVYAKNNLNKFDCVTARALGELNLILEYGIPMLKVNGYFIAPKGSKYQEEIAHAQNALKVLQSEIVKISTFDLIEESGFRANILIKKRAHVSGYPREYARIVKKPL